MKNEKAIFAAGCFWHIENVFSRAKGVIKTRVGYTGGNTKNPDYKEVSSGDSGHAESVEIIYNPEEISYEKLLDIFWKIHNPTSLNKQGADIGTNYRSAIFYIGEKQKKSAVKSMKEHQKELKKSIVTEITKAGEFYPAEGYHQKYFQKKLMCNI